MQINLYHKNGFYVVSFPNSTLNSGTQVSWLSSEVQRTTCDRVALWGTRTFFDRLFTKPPLKSFANQAK